MNSSGILFFAANSKSVLCGCSLFWSISIVTVDGRRAESVLLISFPNISLKISRRAHFSTGSIFVSAAIASLYFLKVVVVFSIIFSVFSQNIFLSTLLSLPVFPIFSMRLRNRGFVQSFSLSIAISNHSVFPSNPHLMRNFVIFSESGRCFSVSLA